MYCRIHFLRIQAVIYICAVYQQPENKQPKKNEKDHFNIIFISNVHYTCLQSKPDTNGKRYHT